MIDIKRKRENELKVGPVIRSRETRKNNSSYCFIIIDCKEI